MSGIGCAARETQDRLCPVPRLGAYVTRRVREGQSRGSVGDAEFIAIVVREPRSELAPAGSGRSVD